MKRDCAVLKADVSNTNSKRKIAANGFKHADMLFYEATTAQTFQKGAGCPAGPVITIPKKDPYQNF